MGKRSRNRQRSDHQARTANSRAERGGRGGERGERGGGRGGRHASPADALAVAEQLIVGAAGAFGEQADEAFAEYVELLVTGPGGDEGRRLVDRAFMSLFDRIVESVWARGWQPADLVRAVSRDVGARQARLAVDAIAAQMRRYAAATVDERWEAQLSSLGATVWWDADDTRLAAWGEREGLDRTGVVRCAVEVLDELSRLPNLPVVSPPPGTARRDRPRRGRPASAADPRLLDRVRALLAKAESTEFTEEADALTAKAQQLIAQHSIDEALLAAQTGTRDEPSARRIGIDNPYEQPKALLLDAVAAANRCKAVWMKAFGFSTAIGFESDLDAVELLYTSLLVQATAAMTREGSKQDRWGRSRTRAFRQSFLTAFAMRIRERLSAAADNAGQQAAQAAGAAGRDRLLPVLAARTEAVDDATSTMFPHLVAKAVSANDAEGVASGRAAADLASLRTRDEVAAR